MLNLVNDIVIHAENIDINQILLDKENNIKIRLDAKEKVIEKGFEELDIAHALVKNLNYNDISANSSPLKEHIKRIIFNKLLIHTFPSLPSQDYFNTAVFNRLKEVSEELLHLRIENEKLNEKLGKIEESVQI